jgi:hypothetical protein
MAQLYPNCHKYAGRQARARVRGSDAAATSWPPGGVAAADRPGALARRPRPRPGAPGGYPAIGLGGLVRAAASATILGGYPAVGQGFRAAAATRRPRGGPRPQKIPGLRPPVPPQPRGPRRGPATGSTARLPWPARPPTAAGVTRPSLSDGQSTSLRGRPPPPGHPSRSRPRPRSSTGAQKGRSNSPLQVPTLRWGPAGPVSTDKSRQHGLTLNSS